MITVISIIFQRETEIRRVSFISPFKSFLKFSVKDSKAIFMRNLSSLSYTKETSFIKTNANTKPIPNHNNLATRLCLIISSLSKSVITFLFFLFIKYRKISVQILIKKSNYEIYCKN